MADHHTDAIRMDQLRLLARVNAMRAVRDSAPTEIPPGASDADLARRLAYDTVASLTRAEITLGAAIVAVTENTEERRRSNDLKAAELDLARRQIEHAERAHEHQRQADARWQTTAGHAIAAGGAWVSAIAFDSRTVTAVISVIVSVIATILGFWGFGPEP